VAVVVVPVSTVEQGVLEAVALVVVAQLDPDLLLLVAMELQILEVVVEVAAPDLKLVVTKLEATVAQVLSSLSIQTRLPFLIPAAVLRTQPPHLLADSRSQPLLLELAIFNSHESEKWTQLPSLLRRVRFGLESRRLRSLQPRLKVFGPSYLNTVELQIS
jgi:hypothetical protein